MSTVRTEKEAVVSEITGKLSGADAVIVTEYRGLTVANLAELRGTLRAAGTEYRVYKNTLARFAAKSAGLDALGEMMTGPTALAFVRGDVAATAKAFKEFAKTNPLLVLRGGMMADKAVSASDLEALADLPPREEMLAKFAGLLQAPMVRTAGLLQALPRNAAYGLAALIEQREREAA